MRHDWSVDRLVVRWYLVQFDMALPSIMHILKFWQLLERSRQGLRHLSEASRLEVIHKANHSFLDCIER
ncbi:MAG: hypothetical protein IGS49_07395 [Chlorogloeopsis fritschii C42_A2020_084]|nr:hypothetical protein [Chlorogloeopsis fritschii C42_A2020_084]